MAFAHFHISVRGYEFWLLQLQQQLYFHPVLHALALRQLVTFRQMTIYHDLCQRLCSMPYVKEVELHLKLLLSSSIGTD